MLNSRFLETKVCYLKFHVSMNIKFFSDDICFKETIVCNTSVETTLCNVEVYVSIETKVCSVIFFVS